MARPLTILAALFACLAAPTNAQAPGFTTGAALGLSGARPAVTILGTHHLANNNRDMVKTGFDDPRSPARQAELRDLLDRLKRFGPTKVAVEAPYGSVAVRERYARYLQGRYELSANEIDQIAFRLAKELGHETVYPIDYRNDFDLEEAMRFGSAHGQADKVEALGRATAVMERLLAEKEKGPLLDMYRWENDPAFLSEGQKIYVYFAELGTDTLYPGADQLARWYQRNARIAVNIIRTASSPSDRVLVLIGSGHAYLLSEILSHSPSVELVPSETLLR